MYFRYDTAPIKAVQLSLLFQNISPSASSRRSTSASAAKTIAASDVRRIAASRRLSAVSVWGRERTAFASPYWT
jgi:hypothetical protein